MRGQGWMAVAPDGGKVATGRLENGEAYVDVLRPALGTAAGILANRPASTPVTCVFSPDGRSLFVSLLEVVGNGSKNTGFGQFWDPATGRPTSPLIAGADTEGPFTHPRVIVF